MRLSKVLCLAEIVLFLLSVRADANKDCSLATVKPFALRLANCTISSSSVDSWGTFVGVGSPPQQLCLVPSTVVNNTLVVGADLRRDDPSDQYDSRHGGLFNTSKAGTSFIGAQLEQLLAPDPGWSGVDHPITVAGSTTLQLPYGIAIHNLPIAVITEGENFNTGHLGLDSNSTFLRLAMPEHAPVKAFGINAGSQSISRPRNGNSVIGGYDSASVDGYFTTYNISHHSGPRRCPLQVQIRELVLRRPRSGDINLVSAGTSVPACIEPYDNLFRLPPTVLDIFRTHTGWSDNTGANQSSVVVVEPGHLFPSSAGFEGSLVFSLDDGAGGSLEVEIPNEELQQPLRGVAPNGTRVLVNELTEVNIFAGQYNLTTAVLGKVFLSQMYLAVDYSAGPPGQFKLARIVQDDVAPVPVPFSSMSSIQCSQSGNNRGLMIGIIVLAVVLGLLIAVLLLFYIQERRGVKIARQASNTLMEQRDTGAYRPADALPPQELRQQVA